MLFAGVFRLCTNGQLGFNETVLWLPGSPAFLEKIYPFGSPVLWLPGPLALRSSGSLALWHSLGVAD
ncbi:3857_t:CDS:2 [Diversispora eburnea]|uniref:3857_t:CDS:1 n=1 Tax=Diversispora eburnea TaxID=1213867 RepID=A0A9N9FQB6_9GLOM|nr:3857_t:CDS:2 [Diversispora eburnea]